MSKKICLLSCREMDGYVNDEDLLIEALKSRGVEVSVQNWEELNDCGEDLFLIRTTWNYTDHLQSFLKTLETVKGRLLNTFQVVGWNSDKKYLLDLAANRVAVVPMKIVGTNKELKTAIDEFGAKEFIIKPRVSASAKGLVRFSKHEVPEVSESMIVQPFISSIADGEISIFYFANRFA